MKSLWHHNYINYKILAMQEISFEEWFDIFYDKCRSMGYRGPIDKYSFDINYDLGETPEQAASEFVNEVNG